MDLKFNTNGLLLAPDPHDWLFCGLHTTETKLVLDFVKENDSIKFIIPHLMGLDLLEMLPGNIVFEFRYTHAGEGEYDPRIVKKFSQYFSDDIVRRASTFELSSSYGCNLTGAACAQRSDLKVIMNSA